LLARVRAIPYERSTACRVVSCRVVSCRWSRHCKVQWNGTVRYVPYPRGKSESPARQLFSTWLLAAGCCALLPECAISVYIQYMACDAMRCKRTHRRDDPMPRIHGIHPKRSIRNKRARTTRFWHRGSRVSRAEPPLRTRTARTATLPRWLPPSLDHWNINNSSNRQHNGGVESNETKRN